MRKFVLEIRIQNATMRFKSSTFANSMVILPLRAPSEIFHRKSIISKSLRNVVQALTVLLRLRSSTLLHLRSAGCMVHQPPQLREPTAPHSQSSAQESQSGAWSVEPAGHARDPRREFAATRRCTRAGSFSSTNRIRNPGRTTNTLSQLLLSSIELLHELLVCRRLFNGVQLAAVRISAGRHGAGRRLSASREQSPGWWSVQPLKVRQRRSPMTSSYFSAPFSREGRTTIGCRTPIHVPSG